MQKKSVEILTLGAILNTKRITSVVLTLSLTFSTFAFSHSGRTNSEGCHNDNSNGTYHCHNNGNTERSSSGSGSSDGDSSSGSDALLALIAIGGITWLTYELYIKRNDSPEQSNILVTQQHEEPNNLSWALYPLNINDPNNLALHLNYKS